MLKGGYGSGNHGHAGRPGQRGGSAPREGAGERFGIEADAELLSQKLGMPPEVCSYLLRRGMIGVSIPPTKEVQPTEQEARGASLGKKYPGQCYDMAGRYMMDQYIFDKSNAKLVHGTISDGTLKIGHGWAEINGKVFDGAQQKFYDRDDYYKTHQAVAERVYDNEQFKKNILKYKHWGPWHNGEGVVAGKKGKKEE